MSYQIYQIEYNGTTYLAAYGTRHDDYDNSFPVQLLRALQANSYGEIEPLRIDRGSAGRTQYRIGDRIYETEGRTSAFIHFGKNAIFIPEFRDDIPVLDYAGTVEPELTQEVLDQYPGSFAVSFDDIHERNTDEFPIGIELLVVDPWTDREVNRMRQRANLRQDDNN